MMFKGIAICICFVLIISCHDIQKDKNKLDYKNSLQHSISFFDKAYDRTKEVYYSEVDFYGDTLSSKIHTVALSRMIYGLSYSSKYFPENLNKAKSLAKFQLNYMLGADSVGAYFIPEVENRNTAQAQKLDIWQQAYGLCGISELYRITHNKDLFSKIQHLNKAFIERFRDKNHGGFYAEYDIKTGGVKGTKTIQSLMYPITAYMANLWLADTINQPIYQQVINEHLAIAYKHVWNDSLEWVNTKFDDHWNPVINKEAWVTPGHNFQFAALLLRSANWPFVSKDNQFKYKELGKNIVQKTLQKDIWVNDAVSNGFYAGINPLNNEVLDANRSWWQHCEAMIALSLCPEYYKEFNEVKRFYFNTFVDKESGGEIANLGMDGKPKNEPKGQKGKSIYHHVEMLRILEENK